MTGKKHVSGVAYVTTFVGLLVGLTTADVATRHTFAARTEPAPNEAFYGR